MGLALAVLTTLVASGRLDRVDRWVDRTLPPDHAPGVVGALQTLGDALANVANPRLVAPVTVVVALWLARRRRPSAVRTVIPAVATASAAVIGLKVVLGRPGPPGSHAVHLLGWWPSGHTTTALVCAGTLAAIGGRRWAWAAGAWTALIAMTMVWSHLHWASDVVGGALLGGLILVLMLPGRPATRSSAGHTAASAAAHHPTFRNRAER